MRDIVNHHRMHSASELMRALECGFALGRDGQASQLNPEGFWAWVRLSPFSDNRVIEFGGWGSRNGLGACMEDLVSYPERWFIGLLLDNSDGSYGDFEVTFEDTLPWIINNEKTTR